MGPSEFKLRGRLQFPLVTLPTAHLPPRGTQSPMPFMILSNIILFILSTNGKHLFSTSNIAKP